MHDGMPYGPIQGQGQGQGQDCLKGTQEEWTFRLVKVIAKAIRGRF